MSFSHTWLETAQRCPKKWEYRYVRGYSRKVKGVKLELGTWVHRLLAAHFRGQSIEQEHQSVLAEFWQPLFEEEQEALGLDLPEKALAIAKRYASHYADDANRWHKVLYVEKALQVRLPHVPEPFTFVCDVVALDRLGWVWIMDHKVVGSIPDEDNRALDTQGPRYVLALRELLRQKGLRVRGYGMIYDYILDRLPAKPERTKTGKISEKWVATDVETYTQGLIELGEDPRNHQAMLDRIAAEGKPFFERWPVTISEARLRAEAEDMRYVVTETLGRSYHPRTLDRNRCNWDCEFKELCLTELQGGDIAPILQRDFDVRKEADTNA